MKSKSINLIFKVGIIMLFLSRLFECKDNSSYVFFEFTVQEVFYIKPPIDSVILVGIVDKGAIHVGDTAIVNCSEGKVTVKIMGLESLEDNDIQKASKGQQVGIRLKGIKKDVPSKGDRVIGIERGK